MARWRRRSISSTARAASARAAASTRAPSPRKENTVRWWSTSAWTFMRVTPSTERIASARRSMTRCSRPSLTFGTHSTAGAAIEGRDMQCILPVGMQFLPIGKLRADTLQAIFDRHQCTDPRVVVGPRLGEDAAVIDMGDRYLVATSDPIPFATAEIGWYALHVNANDIAVRGARPRWFLVTLLLPAGATSDASVDALFTELHAACDELEVALVGGHTEITHGLDRPIVAGTMLGEGGIATALVELADAAGVGLRIDRERILVLPEGRALCEAFGLDPLGTIASGALLMTLAPADAGMVIHALARESIDCHFIGQVVPREQGVTLVSGSRQEPMPVFAQDEIARLFRSA